MRLRMLETGGPPRLWMSLDTPAIKAPAEGLGAKRSLLSLRVKNRVKYSLHKCKAVLNEAKIHAGEASLHRPLPRGNS